MTEASAVKRSHRGVARAASGELVKASVTLPKELLQDVDLEVLMRKRSEPSFNRSALVEEALRAHMLAAQGDRDG